MLEVASVMRNDLNEGLDGVGVGLEALVPPPPQPEITIKEITAKAQSLIDFIPTPPVFGCVYQRLYVARPRYFAVATVTGQTRRAG